MTPVARPVWIPEKIEHWPIERLIPYVANARTHSADQIDKIAKSIERFGFLMPCLCDIEGVLIAGHGRTLAARKLLMPVVPVVIAPEWLSEEDKRAYVLADNKLAEMAGWDEELLAAEMKDLAAAGFDLSFTGFSEAELADFFPPEDPEEIKGQDEIAVPTTPALTREGDVWIIGGLHRLLCGDSRQFSNVKLVADNKLLNLVVTSPPYASQRKYDPNSNFKPIAPDDYATWFRDVAEPIKALLAKDGSYFLNIKEHAEGGTRHLYVKELTITHVKLWGWKFIDEFVWRNLTNGTPGAWANRFKNAWEPIFHFSLNSQVKMDARAVSHVSDQAFNYDPTVNVDMAARTDKSSKVAQTYSTEKHHERYKDGLARPSNVIETRAETGGNGHSAPFPVALPEFFVKAFSAKGDVVYDPFMGSGTTMVAAHKHGRLAAGVEIAPKYCDMILLRMRKLFPGILIEHATMPGVSLDAIAEARGVPLLREPETKQEKVQAAKNPSRAGSKFGSSKTATTVVTQ